MRYNTRNFGDIDIDDGKVIRFASGLPGFEDLRRFTIITDPDDIDDPTAAFFWLQCLDDAAVVFCIVNLDNMLRDYDPLIDEDELAVLGEYDRDSLRVYNLVVIPEDPSDVTVNLKAPIVINTRNMTGKQIICQNEDYAVKHYLFQTKER